MNITSMLTKSFLGYVLTFTTGILVYNFVTKDLENKFLNTPYKKTPITEVLMASSSVI
ncbi:MAG: hypothetical protein O4965_03150 [Trichodesmium sp. St19_bin1]|nr:hypothetical protein [Trichodesmium sp. St19_bin1]